LERRVGAPKTTIHNVPRESDGFAAGRVEIIGGVDSLAVRGGVQREKAKKRRFSGEKNPRSKSLCKKRAKTSMHRWSWASKWKGVQREYRTGGARGHGRVLHLSRH